MIKFSVIVVCLNAGEDLMNTISSILRQTYSSFEVIVKDGFSQDGSLAKLPQDERLILIQKSDNGIYDAMNQAIEVVTGDYTIFINAGDSFYNNDVLEKVCEYIEKYPASLFYGHCYNQYMNINSNAPKNMTNLYCYRSMVCHQATVYESKLLKRKMYDTSFKVSADREIMLYFVVKENLKTQYVPIIIASYKGGGFCESEYSKKCLKEENERLKNLYFSKIQIIYYSFLMALTLPKLRKSIVSNKVLAKYYKKFIGKIYRNKI